MDEVTYEIGTRATAAITNPTWETLELRRTISRTRAEVAALPLAPPEFERVDRSLKAATEEAAAEKPDRYEVGEHLAAAAHALKEAEPSSAQAPASSRRCAERSSFSGRPGSPRSRRSL